MHTHLSLVNQKLGFARALVAEVDREGEPGRQDRLVRQALCEAVVLHIYSAYFFYLRELAEANYLQNANSIDSLSGLRDSLVESARISPEVDEFWRLALQSGSWLNEFLYFYNRMFASPEKVKKKKSFVSQGLIEAIEVSEVGKLTSDLDPKVLTNWIENFYALVARQRESTAEY